MCLLIFCLRFQFLIVFVEMSDQEELNAGSSMSSQSPDLESVTLNSKKLKKCKPEQKLKVVAHIMKTSINAVHKL
jgi:hypothetical protein